MRVNAILKNSCNSWRIVSSKMRSKYLAPNLVSEIASKMPPVSRKVWLLMNDTGLRISDAVKIKYRDIDKKGQIHYKAVKTGKEGVAPVSGDVLTLFGRGRNKPKNDYVFKSLKNPSKHVHRSTVYRHIKKACELCGVDASGVSTHTGRKNFAVRDFRENGLGKTMHDLQHSDVGTTLLYALSDDPIPELFARVKKLEERVDELVEICDMLLEKVVDVDKPLNVVLASTKKGG